MFLLARTCQLRQHFICHFRHSSGVFLDDVGGVALALTHRNRDLVERAPRPQQLCRSCAAHLFDTCRGYAKLVQLSQSRLTGLSAALTPNVECLVIEELAQDWGFPFVIMEEE